MSLSASIRSAVMTVWLLTLSLFFLTGCPPSYENCAANSDCLSDEACAADGVCILKPATPVQIARFSAASTSVESGANVELSWDIQGAIGAEITSDNGTFSYTVPRAAYATGGVMVVGVTETTQYTLTATGSGSTDSERLTVTVTPVPLLSPVIASFNASPTMSEPGDTITLSWSATGAVSGTLVGGETSYDLPASDVNGGSFSVSPDATTTYTLTLVNEGGESTATAAVTVMEQLSPTIIAFSSNVTELVAGAAVTFSWETSGAATVAIRDDEDAEVFTSSDAAMVAAGTAILSPTETTTYTLIASTGEGGASSDPITITVIAEPTITAFAADRQTNIVPGESITLSWDVEDANTITITDSADATVTTSTSATGTFDVTVNADETYTLTATNAAGETTATVSVTVLGAPTITDFTASQETGVLFGAMVNLSWDVTGADTIEIRTPSNALVTSSGDATGTIAVTVNASTTYTLTATNGAGSATATVSVTLLLAPAITSFSASETTDVVPGSLVTLSWETVGATSIELRSPSNAVLHTASTNMGSFGATINSGGVYTLRAINAAGASSSTVSIGVLGAPTLTSFTATPPGPVVTGTIVALSWDVTLADSVDILDEGGTVLNASSDLAGTFNTAITATTTFMLRATNGAGETTGNVTVELLVAPTIGSFTASQSSAVVPGDTITLGWSTTGADTITITNSASATVTTSTSATGTFDVVINADDTYTLTATNGAGDVTATVSVTVLLAPVINTFTASMTTSIVPGDTITLSWNTTGAASITIRDGDNNTVTTSASATGTFDAVINADETFTLTATNGAGDATATVSVTVLLAPVINTFTASMTTDVTVGATVTLSWNTTGADTVTITDSADATVTTSASATGTFDVVINADETFTLTATNGAGDATATVSVTVLPTIDEFSADLTTVISGGRVELSWLVDDATSITIEDDQGGSPYTVPAPDLEAGTTIVRPQVTSTYTLTATSAAAGTVSATVTIIVTAAPLLITEVLYNPTGADGDREWVEIYNTGDTFVDLSNYSLGAGGATYTVTRYQLAALTIAPGQTVVVGGSAVDNGGPVLDQVQAFSPNIQNGGAESDGIALFFLKAADITAASVPIDSVLWTGANINNLLGEDGLPDTEISPDTVETGSLVRTGLSDVFTVATTPRPNHPFHVAQIAPNAGPNTVQEVITIEGFGFDEQLDEVKLGNTLLSCVSTLTELVCEIEGSTPSTDTGLVALTISRVNQYVRGADGEAEVAAATTVYTYTLADAFTFDGFDVDPGVDFYCATLTPSPATAIAADPIVVELLLYAQGSTEGAAGMLPAGWIIEAAAFEVGDVPFEVFGVQWQTWDAVNDTQRDDTFNTSNEIFGLELTSATPRQAEVGWRVSRDGGASWIYCDSDNEGGSDNGWQSGELVEWN